MSQGQLVTMDGVARQSTNADLGSGGRIAKAAMAARGGMAIGPTSLSILRGPGLE